MYSSPGKQDCAQKTSWPLRTMTFLGCEATFHPPATDRPAAANTPVSEWFTDKQFPYLLFSAVTRRQQHRAENILWKGKISCTGPWLQAPQQEHWLELFHSMCLSPHESTLLLVSLRGRQCAPSHFTRSDLFPHVCRTTEKELQL